MKKKIISQGLFLKQFGHISAWLFLIPLTYILINNKENIFIAISFGIFMCGFSWFGMLCISFTESYNIRKTRFINKKEIDYNADMLYDNDDEEKEPNKTYYTLHNLLKILFFHSIFV